MPGHNSPDHGSNMYLSAYNDVVEQIKISSPALSDHDVRIQAAQILRPRYRQDKISEIREAAHLPEYDIGHFTLTDEGEVKYLEYGKTLEEMHQSQIRQRSDEYSPEEHQISRMIGEAFKNGATIVTTVYTREGDDHRDILVMRYDQTTGIGVTSVITGTANEKGETFSAIHEVVRDQFPALTESSPAERVFILSDVRVEEQRGREIIQEVQEIAVEVSKIEPVEERRYWRRETVNSPERTVVTADSDRSISTADRFVDKARQHDPIRGIVKDGEETGKRMVRDMIAVTTGAIKKMHDKGIKDREISEARPSVTTRILAAIKSQFNGDEHIKQDTRKEQAQIGDLLLLEELGATISIDKPEKTLTSIQEVRETMDGAQEVIAFAVESETQGVAIPAAIFALSVLAHPEMMLTEDIPEKREESPVVPLTEKEWEMVIAFLTSEEDSPQEISIIQLASMQVKQETGAGARSEEIDMTVLTWIKELIHRVDGEPVEHALQTIEQAEEVTFRKMVKLWEIILKTREMNFAITKSNSRIYSAPIKEDTHREYTEEKHIEHFSFAMTIWFLLKLDSYYRSLGSLKAILKKDAKHVNIAEVLKEYKPEGLVRKEPAQWILLVMLWSMGELHMAKMRETGFARSKIKNQRSKIQMKNQKVKKQNLPYMGIIFAFAS